jgi:hypothetical protein
MVNKKGLFLALFVSACLGYVLFAVWHKNAIVEVVEQEEAPVQVVPLEDFISEPELRRKLDKFIDFQWNKCSQAWLPNSSQDAGSEQFILFYAHGYLGPIRVHPLIVEFAFAPLERALQDFTYRVCNPVLDSRRQYQSFAQGYDVYQIEQHLTRLIEKRNKCCPGLPVICISHSNGASTLLVALCRNPFLQQNIAGVIFMAPYADMMEVARVKLVSEILGGKQTARKALKALVAPNYDASKMTPLEYVQKGFYSHTLPTLLAHPKNDRVVPYKNFELLRAAFQAKDKQVQFLELERDTHYLRRLSLPLRQGIKKFVSDVLERVKKEPKMEKA